MPGARIRIRGQVQGVGFRPFVWRLAEAHGIGGTVRNDAEGVLIEAMHEAPDSLAAFIAALSEGPPLSRIDAIETDPAQIEGGRPFRIVATGSGTARTRVTPDAIVCTACLAEVFDPAERRHGYPFANCTHCGPRFSIVEAIPYDRATTTMADFAMCPACAAEYGDPSDRRFHAQPIACAQCGPTLRMEPCGARGESALVAAAKALTEGAILAIKALGGFHLACDATDEAAVARLRNRKTRPAKPFAVMAASLSAIEAFAHVSAAEADLLASPAAPIVLLEARGTALAPSLAPGQWAVGVMLPTTPLHALLLAAAGRPLVMTSGNRSGEPQAIDNDEARNRLGPFVDGFLMHDRRIARRLDDSLASVVAGTPRVLRRARGYAPATLKLPDGFEDAPPVAAYGALLKSAIALTRDGEALLSHHLGDLDDILTAEEFEKADRDYAALFAHRAEIIACDLHPDIRSTQYAEGRAQAEALPLERVQHHHAHIAAAMCEAGWGLRGGPVLGLALDGLGLGPDGTVWGGELLHADYRTATRIAHLKAVPLPGGDAAQREPWRNLLAQLDAAGLCHAADGLLVDKPVSAVRAAISRGINAPLTSSAGRLFDAVAAACGLLVDRQTFEGEAAMRLETAARKGRGSPYPFALRAGDPAILDPAPMWQALLADRAKDVSASDIAFRFHEGIAVALAGLCRQEFHARGVGALALSGGVMQNRLLFERLLVHLRGVRLLTHAATPPNDGSIALGQAVIAAARHMA